MQTTADTNGDARWPPPVRTPLVLFGVTGDLAHKMIFPALYAMVKRGDLNVPIVGVALPKWSLERLHRRLTERLFADSAPETGRINYLRFRFSPSAAIALAARVKLAGKEIVGEQRELCLLEEQPGEEAPYA